MVGSSERGSHRAALDAGPQAWPTGVSCNRRLALEVDSRLLVSSRGATFRGSDNVHCPTVLETFPTVLSSLRLAPVVVKSRWFRCGRIIVVSQPRYHGGLGEECHHPWQRKASPLKHEPSLVVPSHPFTRCSGVNNTSGFPPVASFSLSRGDSSYYHRYRSLTMTSAPVDFEFPSDAYAGKAYAGHSQKRQRRM